MDQYDKHAWDALAVERERLINRQTRRLIPKAVRTRASDVVVRARDTAAAVPGYDQVAALVDEAVRTAGEAGGRIAADSVPRKRVLAAYRKAGHDVDLIADIRNLQLRHVDVVKPKLGPVYLSAGVASGALSGVVVSGGQIAAIAGGMTGGAIGTAAGGIGAAPGAGAGAAPGAAAVTSAMVGDTAAVLFASARVVFHTAAYYGYDVDRPEERIRALGVLNFAVAEQGTKLMAYNEAQKLAGMIARSATWKQLDANVITKIMQRVFSRLSQDLTKKRLGSSVVLAAVVLGPVSNARTISAASDAADLFYRQQFICDKYGLLFPRAAGEGEHVRADAHEDEVSISDIVDAEVVKDAVDEGIDGGDPPVEGQRGRALGRGGEGSDGDAT